MRDVYLKRRMILKNSATRILVDTNFWRYAADSGSARELIRLPSKRTIILAAPLSVFEILKMRDESTRDKIISLITLPRWKRLMPEAYYTTLELLHEIRRLRPDWLRTKSNEAGFRQLKNDWGRSKTGFWTRVRAMPSEAAKRIAEVGFYDDLHRGAEMARAQQAQMRTAVPHGTAPPLSGWKGVFPRPTPGWRGDPIDVWRIEASGLFENLLNQPHHPYFEWLHYFVGLPKALSDRESWNSFWLYEARQEHLKTIYLQSNAELLQSFKKINEGTMIDGSLTVYSLFADRFYSADRRLIDVLTMCADQLDIRFAEPRLMPAGNKGFEFFLEDLKIR